MIDLKLEFVEMNNYHEWIKVILYKLAKSFLPTLENKRLRGYRVSDIAFWPLRGILKALVPAKWVAKAFNMKSIYVHFLENILARVHYNNNNYLNCNNHLIYGMSIYRKSLNNSWNIYT